MFAPIDRLFVVCSLSRVKKIYIFKCSFKECQMFNKYWPFNSNFRESSNFCISFCSILFFLSVSISQCISVMHKQMRKIYLLPTHHSRKRVYIIYHTLCLSNFALSLPYTHTHPFHVYANRYRPTCTCMYTCTHWVLFTLVGIVFKGTFDSPSLIPVCSTSSNSA